MPPRRQQAANGDANAVRGPTSALTSFLREQGITGHNIQRRPAPQPAPALQDVAENEDGADASTSNAVASTSTSTTTTTVQVQVETSTTTSGGKKRKANAAAAAKKKKKQDDSDGEGFDIAGKKEGPKPGRYDNRTPGAIAVCGECGKKFTVTKYTSTNPSGPGLLCSPCTTDNIETVGNRPKPVRAPKKKAPKMLEQREFKIVKTLQQACLAVIGSNIESVQSLGDIGPKNVDRISKIVSKHRALSADNLEIFLDVDHTELRLYDCTNLRDTALASIASFCPNLETLVLKMCGQLDDAVLEAWGPRLNKLRELDLYAAYLVTTKAWDAYFTTFNPEHELTTFRLQQSARFNDHNLSNLVAHCPNLTNLKLSELGRISNESLQLLYPLKELTTLEISRIGTPEGTALEDEAIIGVLENIGENLEELVLDQNYKLTDRVLLEGIKVNCPRLRRLSLKGLGEVQSTGVQSLFTDWVNTGLTELNIHRCILIDSDAFKAIITHSGETLTRLDMHSVDMVEDKALYEMAAKCDKIKWLDVSFVRAVDNFVLKEMLEKMTALETVFVHGNNRVTHDCPQKKGVSIRGLEGAKLVEL